MAVQIGAMALLVQLWHVHYLAAAVLAVEAAVLHNFCWHQQWTWRDRPPGSWRTTAVRLARFQLLNGSISLAGNIAVVAFLTGRLDIDPVVASAVAIAACSLMNFAATESLVFKTTSVRLAAGFVVLAMPSMASAGPDPSTLKAWDTYVRSVEARYDTASSGAPFFAQDRPGGTAGWRDAIGRGAVSMSRFEPPSHGDGRIHHWAGAVFVPDTSVAQVIARLLERAGTEADFYEDVVESRLLARDGDRVRVYMKLRRTTIITATFNTEHAVEYRRLGPDRASSRSVATRIAELAEAGTPDEHERQAGGDRGFLWKLNAYWRFEAVRGGVLVECESLSLSRGVPLLLRRVANPIVDRVARESLEKTLEGLKAFLQPGKGISGRGTGVQAPVR